MTADSAHRDDSLQAEAGVGPSDGRQAEAAAGTKARREVLGLRASALVEIVLFLALAVAVDMLLFDGTRWWEVRPHPFWIIVLLIIVQYGSGEALIAAALATVALLSGTLPEQSIHQEFYEHLLQLLSRPVMWLTAAVLLGELRGRQIREREDILKRLEETSDRLNRLAGAYDRLERIKQNLEVRVAGQLDTFVTTYRAARAIEKSDPGEVLLGVVEVIRSIINPEKFSLFLLNNNVLEASIQDGWERGDKYARIFDANTLIFHEIVGQRRLLCAANTADQQLLEPEGVLAGPLLNTDTDEVIGMLKVEKLALFDLNVSTIENFRALSAWIGTAYSNALAQSGDQTEGDVYVGRTILPYRFFAAQQAFVIALGRRLGFDVSAVQLHLAGSDELAARERTAVPAALGNALRLAMSGTDLCFEYQDTGRDFIVLMPGVDAREAEEAAERLVQALHDQLREQAPAVRFEATVQALHAHGREEVVDVGGRR